MTVHIISDSYKTTRVACFVFVFFCFSKEDELEMDMVSLQFQERLDFTDASQSTQTGNSLKITFMEETA